MAPPLSLVSAPTPPSLDQLRDELDLLLVDYLEAIEHYQQARHSLDTRLKSASLGFFDLARAKLALGPAHVGPARYDLTAHASHRVVRITPNETARVPQDATANAPSWSFALADRPDDDADDDASADFEPLHATLRHRVRTTTSSSARSPPQEATAVTHADVASSSPTQQQQQQQRRPPQRPSPLTQFAALPPPALRTSATAFTQALQVAVGIVDAEARVRECARRIKRARKLVDRRREEAEEASSG